MNSAISDDLTESERRAFEFGPRMRRLAQEHCDGSLPLAHIRFSDSARVEQHRDDVQSIRLKHRPAFIALIEEAGGLGDDLRLSD